MCGADIDVPAIAWKYSPGGPFFGQVRVGRDGALHIIKQLQGYEVSAAAWESDVLRAAGQDRWPDNLRRHLGECDDCVATAAVAPWMSTFAGMSDREHILPDPSIVWLKAKLLLPLRLTKHAKICWLILLWKATRSHCTRLNLKPGFFFLFYYFKLSKVF